MPFDVLNVDLMFSEIVATHFSQEASHLQNVLISTITHHLCALKLVNMVRKGPFKYYVIKEVGGWGQNMAIFDDLQYYKSSKRLVGGSKKVKNMMT